MIKLDLSEKEKNGLTNDEIEIAKARKLELLILPHLKRNINFFYSGANIPKKSNSYNAPLNTQELGDSIAGKKSSVAAVCKSLCEMVAQILQDNGIKAETVSCDTDMFRHIDVLVTTSSGKQFIINYLEDIENIQTGMKTPDFASERYYQRRYQKFENGLTTDGKRIDNIYFFTEEQLRKIDTNLGYIKCGMYMDQVIDQIKLEFENFRTIAAENEYAEEVCKLQKQNAGISEEEKRNLKEKISEKFQKMSDDEVLEAKLDWLFNYFNERMDITGHTDLVMYHGRLLLKQVLSPEEYQKISRYDCFVYKDNVPEDSPIQNVLDHENEENTWKSRFCLVSLGNKAYAFSTKPKVYAKINEDDLEKLKQYAKISKAEKPSDLIIKLCDRGNALPLIFHPLGTQFINDRAKLIPENLSDEDKRRETDKLVASIKTTDGDLTSIRIPYPNGGEKFIYIDENNEFVVQDRTGKVIYHYDERNDNFITEKIDDEIER